MAALSDVIMMVFTPIIDQPGPAQTPRDIALAFRILHCILSMRYFAIRGILTLQVTSALPCPQSCSDGQLTT